MSAGGTTTVLVGVPAPGVALRDDQALLVTASTPAVPEVDYLIWNDRRARIELTDPAMREALQLNTIQPRLLDDAVLIAIPEGPPVVAPVIGGAGLPTVGFTVLTSDGRPLVVGDVFEVRLAGPRSTFQVVRTDGVEQIPAVAADLIRFSATGSGGLAAVDPQELAAAPVATADLLASDQLPASVPELLDVRAAPMICATWDADAGWSVTVGSAIPDAVPPVSLSTSAGGQVDQVVIEPSRGALVRGVGSASGTAPPEQEAPATYLVTDLGIAFPVGGGDTLRRLGYGEDTSPVPLQILDLLPLGPKLDTTAVQQFWADTEVAVTAATDDRAPSVGDALPGSDTGAPAGGSAAPEPPSPSSPASGGAP